MTWPEAFVNGLGIIGAVVAIGFFTGNIRIGKR